MWSWINNEQTSVRSKWLSQLEFVCSDGCPGVSSTAANLCGRCFHRDEPASILGGGNKDNCCRESMSILDKIRTDLTFGVLFTNFTQVSNADFEVLVLMFGPIVPWENTNDRLAVTLRFLATWDSYHSLMYWYEISKQAIYLIIHEVLVALVNCWKHYVQTPTEPERWDKIASGHKGIWQFDQCIEALDGNLLVFKL